MIEYGFHLHWGDMHLPESSQRSYESGLLDEPIRFSIGVGIRLRHCQGAVVGMIQPVMVMEGVRDED